MLLHELQVARFVLSSLSTNDLNGELSLGIVPPIEIRNHRNRERKICERCLLSIATSGMDTEARAAFTVANTSASFSLRASAAVKAA